MRRVKTDYIWQVELGKYIPARFLLATVVASFFLAVTCDL